MTKLASNHKAMHENEQRVIEHFSELSGMPESLWLELAVTYTKAFNEPTPIHEQALESCRQRAVQAMLSMPAAADTNGSRITKLVESFLSEFSDAHGLDTLINHPRPTYRIH